MMTSTNFVLFAEFGETEVPLNAVLRLLAADYY